MKLKRKKIGDRSYLLVDAKTGTGIALAAQTGEHGRDNYPWEWHLVDEAIFGRLGASSGRSEESLKVCVDYIETELNASGLLKPAEQISGYDVKEGQVFRYTYHFFRALADAYGESNAYIPVNDHRGENTEIIVLHGNTVTPYAYVYEPLDT